MTYNQPEASDPAFTGDPTFENSNTFSGSCTFSGKMIFSQVSKDSNYTASASDFIIGVDTSSSAVTITLPSSAVSAGKIYIINDEGGNAGTNNITVATEGSETIDGSASATISSNNGTLRLYSDGSNWFSF